MITTILFDLDGTLLPMNMESFTAAYFRLLADRMAPYGYEKKDLIDAIWTGTGIMVQNDGSVTNEEAFWAFFRKRYGEQSQSAEARFDQFYRVDFAGARSACGFNPKVPALLAELKAAGYRLALATNPIFPEVATRQRTAWAGLSLEDFEWFTTYENSRFCKPNPAYYSELLARMGLRPEECLMVGNDVEEDMVARTLGMSVFLITDCLINRNHTDLSAFPHGDFDDLRAYIQALPR